MPDWNRPILVVGDVILDEYLIGKATRLSREAAVPVLERTRRQLIPGGAANPAVGIVALGGQSTLVGVVGEDDHAKLFPELLATRNVTPALLTDSARPTTVKTRLLAEGGFVYAQHLARIDHLSRESLAPAFTQVLLDTLTNLAPAHRVILLSDYKNGVVTADLIKGLYPFRDRFGVALIVDSQGDLERFRHFDILKCNRAEAEEFLGEALTPAHRPTALASIRERCDAKAVVVTLGAEGIAWCDEHGYGDCRAPRAEVYDVTGAGDTVIAVLALAQASGLPLAEGCRLAVHAAALSVRVMGNYAPTRAELEQSLANS
jgi:D-glycero-beta-D-manno-heptose-7-phosphate kinase